MILVADDEPTLCRLVSTVLTQRGLSVRSVGDAEAALAAVRSSSEPVAVVILDLGLPPEGAEPLMRALLDEDSPPHVVLTSGAPPPAGTRRLLESCGGRFLSKPFAARALLDAVSAAPAGAP